MKKNELGGLLGQLKTAAEKLVGRIRELDQQTAELNTRRQTLISAPLSKEEYMTLVRLDIDAKATRFRNMVTRNLKSDYAAVTYLSLAAAQQGQLGIRPLDAGENLANAMPEGAYYYYFGDQLCAGVERALESRGWPADAPSIAERDAAIAEIDAQIVALQAERDDLASELNAAGLMG